MHEVVEIFDEWLDIARFHSREAGVDYEVATNPGVSEEDLVEVERELGFSLVPEARDLYKHANGLTLQIPLFLFGLGFPPLQQATALTRAAMSWIQIERLEAENDWPGGLGPDGVPIRPFPIFAGPGCTMHIECAEPWTGLMSFLDSDGFLWVARSLTGFLQATIEAYRNEHLVWSHHFEWFEVSPAGPLPTLVSNKQFGDPVDLQNCGAYYWRWSGWRSETDKG